MSSYDADPKVVRHAFEYRFEQIKLSRMQREFPHLLPKEQQAPFFSIQLGTNERTECRCG